MSEVIVDITQCCLLLVDVFRLPTTRKAEDPKAA